MFLILIYFLIKLMFLFIIKIEMNHIMNFKRVRNYCYWNEDDKFNKNPETHKKAFKTTKNT